MVKVPNKRSSKLVAFKLAIGLVVGSSYLAPAISKAATQDADNPAELTIDGKIKNKSKIVDDKIPRIELPEKLEILPPKDNNSQILNKNADTDGMKNSDAKPILKATELPVIQRDFSKLPKHVAQMRTLIMNAARSGKIEDLRELIGSGEDITMLSLGGIDGDPIEFFKSLSGDNQGHEILAILLEVLEAGYVHLDAGTDHELYVWPYFFALPLDKLTAVQKVELFRIVTAGDFQDMQAFGAYIFYRVGITPQGRWRFFVAGD